jgi:hypothetical protein
MFEKPQVYTSGDSISIQIADEQATRLLSDLRAKGFDAELTEGTLGFEDLNSGERTEVRVIEFRGAPDKNSVRTVLRAWITPDVDVG